MLIKHIRTGFSILSNPEKAFRELEERALEDIVGYYMMLLVLASAAAGVAFFLFSSIKTLYLDIFMNVSVVYGRVLNYLLGRSLLLIFLYIFIGTFILFLISLIIKLFFPKISYIHLLKIMLPSLTPLLLFSWIPISPMPFIVWSIFLFAIGIRCNKIIEIKKGSIRQRY